MNKAMNWLPLNRLMVVFVFILVAASIQKFILGYYNNYLMFARPFDCLLTHRSMYVLRPELYSDLYKYSPVFAWLMAPFYYMPDWLGVTLWNLLNPVVLILGVWYFLKDEYHADCKRWIALAIIFPEALITAQNMQSNNLIVGMMLLGIYLLRKEKVWLAALLFTLCFYIKFYGVGAAIFFLFYPRKVQFLVAMVVWTVIFALLPATVISFAELGAEYEAWLKIVVDSKLGLLVSVPGILVYWFDMAKTDGNLRIVEAVGITLFLLPFLRFKQWKMPVYQQLMVAYFLLFVIIFNKMAESPTYVLAVVGVAIWWVTAAERNTLDRILLGLVVVFTSLSPTDLFPPFIRDEYMNPYSIKAVPCVLVWLRMQYQLWTIQSFQERGKTGQAVAAEVALK
ncbi:glycosyltransferase family 87 protein [Arsenicibacter rosenii]|nr:glycosyltransferase family 87 protein [Arsenicibacter rosenii]